MLCGVDRPPIRPIYETLTEGEWENGVTQTGHEGKAQSRTGSETRLEWQKRP